MWIKMGTAIVAYVLTEACESREGSGTMGTLGSALKRVLKSHKCILTFGNEMNSVHV